MSASEENQEEIERILVAIDGSPQSLAALRLAAELASRIDAELIGLYVEDINLLRMAELPIAREVGFYSARVQKLDIDHIKRQLRAQARRAEHALALIAESMEVHWSFRITRGFIPAELLAAANDTDLIILGKAGWSRRRKLGSTAQTMVVQSERQILIFQEEVKSERPVLVIYDGSKASQKALDSALKLKGEDSPLTVLILASEAEEMRAIRSEIQNWATKHEFQPSYRWSTQIDEDIIANQAWSINCGLLVLPASDEFLASQRLIDLLNRTRCAVYLVR